MANPRCSLSPSLGPSFPKFATIRHGGSLSRGRTDHKQSSNGYSQHRSRNVVERRVSLRRLSLVALFRDGRQPLWAGGGSRLERTNPWLCDTPTGIRTTGCSCYGYLFLVVCAARDRS